MKTETRRRTSGVIGSVRALFGARTGGSGGQPPDAGARPAGGEIEVLEVARRLAGGMAHDMNNVLLVVQGYTEMALAEQDAGPSTRALLKEMKEATARAVHLVCDLLIVGQRGPLSPRRVDINEVVSRFQPALQNAAGDSIRVQSDLSREPLPVLVEDELIGRMLSALVARARDSMPDGGTVTVSTARGAPGSATAAVLRVFDTGLPLSDETRAHVFEPYLPGRGGGKGQGLGMSIAWGVARRLGATIRVESSGPGGTVFAVELPLRDEEMSEPPRPAAAVGTETTPAPSGSATILIAEDDESLLGLAAKILTREGYTVLRASDGQEAVEAFERDHARIDLVILDDVMPRMGGRAALARIRHTAPEVPAILCSGYSWSLDGQQPEPSGPCVMLPKPWQPRELIRRVREGLERKR